MAWLDDISDRIEAMPAWARPPFFGMFLVYGMIAARGIIVVPIVVVVLVKGGPAGLLQAVWILIVAGLAGFAGGAAYSVFRPMLRRLGRFGAYATGWLCVAAYIVLLFPIISSDDPQARNYFSIRDRAGQVTVVICSLLFGSILGRAFVDPERTVREPRHWIQRKQRVTSRVRPPAPHER